MARDCSRLLRNARAERSAPAAKINGFPVIAIAAGLLATAAEIASLRAAKDCAPNVFGRVWSKPLSKVISANVPLNPNGVRSTGRRIACVRTSSGAPSGSAKSAGVLIISRPS
ncbi:unannotated protein [freshwater metagenome]|uniref:Unannotated protein n=1 Tax=freshwater metagenome TaxID=449393 RepID=A0A6J6IC71_9ZZZZ